MAKINTAERVSAEASDNFVFQRSLLAYHAAAARIAGDVLVKLKEITVTSEIAQIDMDLSDIDLRSFSKLIIRPALACTDNVDYRLRFGSGEGTIFRHYVNREFANYDYAARSSCAPATAATTSPPES